MQGVITGDITRHSQGANKLPHFTPFQMLRGFRLRPCFPLGPYCGQCGHPCLLTYNPYLSKIPAFLKMVFAILVAAAFGMILAPMDDLKVSTIAG